MENKTSIENIQQLKKIFALRRFLSYPIDFDLAIPELTEADRLKYRYKIGNYSSQCGCESGQFFIVLFAFLYIFLYFFSKPLPTQYSILNFFIFIIIGAFLGKFIGLIKASFDLRKLIREIEKNMS